MLIQTKLVELYAESELGASIIILAFCPNFQYFDYLYRRYSYNKVIGKIL